MLSLPKSNLSKVMSGLKNLELNPETLNYANRCCVHREKTRFLTTKSKIDAPASRKNSPARWAIVSSYAGLPRTSRSILL